MAEEKKDALKKEPRLDLNLNPTDLKKSSHEELIQLAAGLMEKDPVQGAALTGLIIGRGKPTVKKQAIALAAYLQYMKYVNPKAVGHVDLAKFLRNPPPKLHRVMMGMIVGMEEKGYK